MEASQHSIPRTFQGSYEYAESSTIPEPNNPELLGKVLYNSTFLYAPRDGIRKYHPSCVRPTREFYIDIGLVMSS